ncbi:MAG: hypothetical protein KF788_11505 [Piscinibacter sp.]|nr:hypothetical protein [Piscinibacter sp.]
MVGAAMLQAVNEAAEGVLVLIDGLEEADFRRSRLTRAEVRRQLRLMADLLLGLPPDLRASLPEIDWAGWQAIVRSLGGSGAGDDDAPWFAARSLVPATLSWLRVYRREQPALFAYTA